MIKYLQFYIDVLLPRQGSVSSISGGSKDGPVITTAMIHWDKALTELPASMTVDDTEYGTTNTNATLPYTSSYMFICFPHTHFHVLLLRID